MRIRLSPSITSRFPDYVRYVVVARGIDNHREGQIALREAEAVVRADPAMEAPHQHPRIANWREAFVRLGLDPDVTRPSAESLVARLRNNPDTQLAYHNTVVALANWMSLRHLVPCGADDLGLVHGDIELRPARDGELFVPVSGNRVERTTSNEVILADRRKVMCRHWVWQQGAHTAVTRDTRDVAINIDVLPPVTREEGMRIAEELAAQLTDVCGGQAMLFTLDKDNPVAEFETPPFTFEETVYDTLELRGYIEQADDREQARTLLRQGTTLYQGFDPTAPSLHVGHLLSLMVLHYLQQAGNRVIFILGGGTAQVGDPSGRSEGRKMISVEEVAHNADGVKAQVQNMGLLNFVPAEALSGQPPAIMLDNNEWLQTDLLRFLREVTPHFSVNRMVKRDDFRNRLETGDPLSLFELVYTTLQGYDYLWLFDHYECRLQVGGNDQWINLTDGIELIHHKRGVTVHAMTFPLILDRSGQKMGKTASGEKVWLADSGLPEFSMTPFGFYQFWVNIPDNELQRYFSLFTFLPLDEIDDILTGHPRAAQHRLAYEVTRIVHGEEIARRLWEDAARGFAAEAPAFRFTAQEIAAGIQVTSVLVKLGVRSRSEARRLIEQGGVTLGGRRLGRTDLLRTLALEDFAQTGSQRIATMIYGKGKIARLVLAD